MTTIRAVKRTIFSMRAGISGFELIAIVGLAACGGLEPVTSYEPITDPTQLYTSLKLNYAAVNLSTAEGYNVLQLTATPLNALGEPLLGLPTPIFTSNDTSRVKVTADGLVTALKAGTSIPVIADLPVNGNTRHADTAMINVADLAAPPVLADFSIDPLTPSGDNWPMRPAPVADVIVAGTIWSGISIFTLPPAVVRPNALDAAGDAVPGLQIEYESLDPAVAGVDRWTGFVTLRQPGQVRLAARTMAYGIAKADTFAFTVTFPLGQDIIVRRMPNGAAVFDPNEVAIVPGGFLYWINKLDESVDITFDDPTDVSTPPTNICNAVSALGPGPHCGAGNVSIPVVGDPGAFGGYGQTVQVRQFLVPGVYHFTSSRTGAAIGTVVVTTTTSMQ